jgi:3-oxoacyl-[acyl-carrier protein] reductase
MNDNPVVLVTGGTRGIGYSIVQEFLKEGKQVICCSRKDREQINKQFTSLLSNEPLLDYVTCDTTSENAVKSLFSYILDKYKRLDVLVNNVGGSMKKPLLAMNGEEIGNIIDINLLSTINCTKGAVKSMLMQHKGKIINISSTAGTNGLPLEAVYCAAKAGIIGFTKSVTKEYGSKGIQCNAVVPGIIQTEENNTYVPEDIVKTIPQNRTGTPLDIAGVVSFLASEKAAYINGQAIKVDGGLYI